MPVNGEQHRVKPDPILHTDGNEQPTTGQGVDSPDTGTQSKGADKLSLCATNPLYYHKAGQTAVV